jgi:hypothetical protein
MVGGMDFTWDLSEEDAMDDNLFSFLLDPNAS